MEYYYYRRTIEFPSYPYSFNHMTLMKKVDDIENFQLLEQKLPTTPSGEHYLNGTLNGITVVIYCGTFRARIGSNIEKIVNELGDKIFELIDDIKIKLKPGQLIP